MNVETFSNQCFQISVIYPRKDESPTKSNWDRSPTKSNWGRDNAYGDSNRTRNWERPDDGAGGFGGGWGEPNRVPIDKDKRPRDEVTQKFVEEENKRRIDFFNHDMIKNLRAEKMGIPRDKLTPEVELRTSSKFDLDS